MTQLEKITRGAVVKGILPDAADPPLEITGRRLRGMRDSGELTLYPAKYRLVYEDDETVRAFSGRTEAPR